MVGYSCDKVNPPKPHLTQAARANVSIFAFTLIYFFGRDTPNPNGFCIADPFMIILDSRIYSPPSKAYLEDLFTADYYSSPASL